MSTELVDVLLSIGVDVRKDSGKEITGRCPVHERVTGHADNSPSWSMNASSGLWICFSCGARGTLGMLVEELTGSEDALSTVRDIAFKAASDRVNGFTSVSKAQPDVDWLTFSRFSEVPEPQLASRNISQEQARHYGIRWNSESKAWVIPIVSRTGELLGWQEKRSGWVKNVPTGVEKSTTLFGLNKFSSNTAVLLESPLDVVRLSDVFDKPQGLASFGSAVSEEQLRIMSMVADRLLIAMDNDKAGLQAARTVYKSASLFRKGVMFLNYGNSSCKDIGEMSDKGILKAISTATIIPPWVNS